MVSIFLDAYLFACPTVESGPAAAEEFIRRILSWKDIRDRGWAALCLSSTAFEALSAEQYYPAWVRVAQLLAYSGIEDIAPKDVSDLVNSLLSKTQTVEDVFGLECLVNRVDWDTEGWMRERPAAFLTELERLAALALVAHLLLPSDANDPVIVTAGVAGECARPHVSVNVDFDARHPEPRTELAREIEGIVAVCGSYKSLCGFLEPARLWRYATADNERHHAILMALFARGPDRVLDHGERGNLQWSFGGEFIESAARLGFTHEAAKIQRLLRACVNCILREDMRSTHEIRTSEAGDAPQLLRGGHGAWRRDIDHEFHLHYWQTEDGPEFASVVHHNDMSIPR
jgi:hypothetical protein